MDNWEEVMKKELQVVKTTIKEAEEAATKRERERILTILEKLYDSEYGGMPTLDELIWIVEGDESD